MNILPEISLAEGFVDLARQWIGFDKSGIRIVKGKTALANELIGCFREAQKAIVKDCFGAPNG